MREVVRKGQHPSAVVQRRPWCSASHCSLSILGNLGLENKWVSSCFSLLEVCTALGFKEFLNGKKVCKKGRVTNVLGYEFRHFSVCSEFQYITV